MLLEQPADTQDSQLEGMPSLTCVVVTMLLCLQEIVRQQQQQKISLTQAEVKNRQNVQQEKEDKLTYGTMLIRRC